MLFIQGAHVTEVFFSEALQNKTMIYFTTSSFTLCV